MVCLGNICRSPVAEGILRSKLLSHDLDIEVDSCGTANYHIGAAPDPRMIQVSKENGIDISTLTARQFCLEDFNRFDVIYTMDKNNYNDVRALAQSERDARKIRMLLEENGQSKNKNVPDPYYGSLSDFRAVFELLDEHMDLIVDKLNDKG